MQRRIPFSGSLSIENPRTSDSCPNGLHLLGPTLRYCPAAIASTAQLAIAIQADRANNNPDEIVQPHLVRALGEQCTRENCPLGAISSALVDSSAKTVQESVRASVIEFVVFGKDNNAFTTRIIRDLSRVRMRLFKNAIGVAQNNE